MRSIKFKTDTINSNIDEMKSTLSKINTNTSDISSNLKKLIRLNKII